MESSNDDLLSRLLRRVPGFRGYLQQEDRQRSEEQTRQFVNDQLQAVKAALDHRARVLADEGRITELAPIDSLRRRIEAIRSQVDRPALGFSGLIGAESLDENDLEDLYDLEANLMDCSVVLSDAVRESISLTTNELSTLEDKLNQLAALVDRRKALLRQLMD